MLKRTQFNFVKEMLMKAAVIHSYGTAPRFDDFPEPTPRGSEQVIEVTAAAISNLARSRVAGTHYSDHGHLPAVAGVDGVGRLSDGRRVYFGALSQPYGSMAQLSLVGGQMLPVPAELDDVTVAALINPGVSAWMSLAFRARLKPGERVLIVGATGVTGKLAVQAAKLQGAAAVVAAGRNPDSLRSLDRLGADETIQLTGDLRATFADALARGGIDVVIDYLWGAPTEALLDALGRRDLAAAGRQTRLVHVGAMAGASITLPGAVLRSTDLVILGNGTGSMRPDDLAVAVERVLQGAITGALTIDTRAVPLSDVEAVWNADGQGTRTVLVPNG
jgi:NADPH:quinone reductase-like Zn-dependent oxidoreductase